MPMAGTFRTLLTLTACLFTTFLHMGYEAVIIHNLRTPAPVENGTEPSALLDCDFSYEENELDGLVIKWYIETIKDPVYQWIPKQSLPQSAGILRGRLDLEFRASEDNFTMFRALRIVHPTAELSGNYRCQVSSFKNEDEKSGVFVVYAPATFVDIGYTKPRQDAVNVTCKAEGMYPEPEARIVVRDLRHNETSFEKATVVSHILEQGGYAIVAHKLFEDRKLSGTVEFECKFSIPIANYVARDNIKYSPGNYTIGYTTPEEGEALGNLSTPAHSIVWASTELPPHIGQTRSMASSAFDKMAVTTSILGLAFLCTIVQNLHQ